jgi:peptide deformylase
MEAEGLLAVVLQHEIDHLNGILFINRISSLKRGIYKRKVKKNLKTR